MPPTRSAGPPGLLIAAPASGSGKTVLTLSLLRAFRRRGVRVASAKSGPDYIDPAFHSAAGGRSCVSLDSWAMHPMQIRRLVHRAATEADLFLLEGAMGLFDGAIGPVPGPRDGSCAALALQMGLPVVLVVDCRSMLAST
ncbi:MAG: cobyrinic acid a,c-diamide synthase, partial [Rhodospirillaceae bacterium]